VLQGDVDVFAHLHAEDRPSGMVRNIVASSIVVGRKNFGGMGGEFSLFSYPTVGKSTVPGTST